MRRPRLGDVGLKAASALSIEPRRSGYSAQLLHRIKLEALVDRNSSNVSSEKRFAGDDPVKFGLVESLNKPGGMATGVAWLTSELFTKRLEILRDLVPRPNLIGVLINPESPEVEPQIKEIETAARRIGQAIHTVRASHDAPTSRPPLKASPCNQPTA